MAARIARSPEGPAQAAPLRFAGERYWEVMKMASIHRVDLPRHIVILRGKGANTNIGRVHTALLGSHENGIAILIRRQGRNMNLEVNLEL
jgi:hypothetical protein